MARDFQDESVDFIIVGAGSAGCVLANRLSADKQTRVMLLEAGGDDRPFRNPSQFLSNMMIHIPAGFVNIMDDPKVNWNFKTNPDPFTNDRTYAWPRGKVLGGSSSINGLVYVRGQPEDYDGWRQLGCDGWSWSDVLPYFKRSENQQRAADALHGQGGLLNVSDNPEHSEVSDAVIDACAQAGLPRRQDVNGPDQEGATLYQQTAKGGLRCSTAVAFLHPAMKRSNLKVITGALASKVLIEGNRAVGVAYVRDGIIHKVYARREVILSGGAINSPQLLQLSGVGEAGLLRKHGIEVVINAPEVGENLQDHFGPMISYRLQPHVHSVNELTHGWRFAREMLRYATQRKGLLTYGAGAIAVFCKSRPDLATPDIQYHVLGASFDMQPKRKSRIYKRSLEREPGLTFAAYAMRPESRGSIRIASPDPMMPPAIAPNYLSSRADQEVSVQAVRWVRKIVSQPALKPYIAHEIRPGRSLESETDLLEYTRASGDSRYHPSGTCRMGAEDRSVVDPQLRVRGVAGLRVVDASIMPRLISGNTNAPVIMIAEKASDMILGAGTA